MSLAWGERVSPAFRQGIAEIASSLGCDPSWLMACIAFETGRTFDPAARNKQSGAVGLIQFMPSTAVGLGTTTDELAAMTAEQQLAYVAKYFARFAGRLHTLSDVYMAILWPRAVGESDDYVLFAEGSAAYEQNKALDIGRDGRVTKADASRFVIMSLADGYEHSSTDETQVAPTPAPPEEQPTMPETDTGPSFGSIAKGIAGVAGAVFGGPFAPLIVGLANSLIDAFTPAARAKIADVVNSKVPGAGEAIANIVIDTAKKITGADSPIQAVADAQKDPAKIAAIEQASIDRIVQLAPMMDKLAVYDKQTAQLTVASQDAAAARTGGEDLRPRLAVNIWIAIAVLGVGLMVAIVTEIAMRDDHLPQNDLVVLFGSVATYLLARLGDVYGYAFGGVQKNTAGGVLTDELARRK